MAKARPPSITLLTLGQNCPLWLEQVVKVACWQCCKWLELCGLMYFSLPSPPPPCHPLRLLWLWHVCLTSSDSSSLLSDAAPVWCSAVWSAPFRADNRLTVCTRVLSPNAERALCT